jgi:hypothetical protein
LEKALISRVGLKVGIKEREALDEALKLRLRKAIRPIVRPRIGIRERLITKTAARLRIVPKLKPQIGVKIKPTIPIRPIVRRQPVTEKPAPTKILPKIKLAPVARPKLPEKRYVPFVRRYGKFMPVAKPTKYVKAKKIGVRELRRTLGAALKIKEVKKGEFVPFTGKIGREFRLGKRDRRELIQRAPFRLGRRAEVAEIIAARKVGGIKLI